MCTSMHFLEWMMSRFPVLLGVGSFYRSVILEDLGKLRRLDGNDLRRVFKVVEVWPS